MTQAKSVSPLEMVRSALPATRRANRLPIYVAIGVLVLSGSVIIYGIASRGLSRGQAQWSDDASGLPASNFGDRLKDGIADGIIAAPAPPQLPIPAPLPVQPPPPAAAVASETTPPVIDDWQERLTREHDEQVLRELNRQQLMALQADRTALEAPIAVDLGALDRAPMSLPPNMPASSMRPDLSGLLARAQGETEDGDQQAAKLAFLQQGNAGRDGVLDQTVAHSSSPFELKRGSVIPAVLLTGINSDLPGRIIAQVSQNVFDSATGRHLLIPQGSRLFGRYDADVTFGQDRVLVVWTDLVFPNGDTLLLEGMAGSDSQGYGGFTDEVDPHYPEIFGTALLVGLIGAGVDMLMPDDSDGADDDSGDAVRGSLGERFGEVGSKSMDRNLDVQPTLTIRTGYVFNVIVEEDLRLARAW